MKPFPLLLALLFSLLTAKAQNKNTYVGQNIVITFPAPVEQREDGTVLCRSAENVYVLNKSDYSSLHKDVAEVAMLKDEPGFAAGIVKGLTETLPETSFDNLKQGKQSGYTTYTVTGKSKDGRVYRIFLLLMDRYFYTLSSVSKNEDAAKEPLQVIDGLKIIQ